jgi:hypothetical protein
MKRDCGAGSVFSGTAAHFEDDRLCGQGHRSVGEKK